MPESLAICEEQKQPRCELADGVQLVSLAEDAVCVFNPKCFRPLRIQGEAMTIKDALDGSINSLPPAVFSLLGEHALLARVGQIPREGPRDVPGRRTGFVLCAATQVEVDRLEAEWPRIAGPVPENDVPATGMDIMLIAHAESGDALPLSAACQRVHDFTRVSRPQGKIPMRLRAQFSLPVAADEVKALASILKPSFRCAIHCGRASEAAEVVDALNPLIEAGFRPDLRFPLSRATVRHFADWFEALRAAWGEDFRYDFDWCADPADVPQPTEVRELLESLGTAPPSRVMQQGRVYHLQRYFLEEMGQDLEQLRSRLLFASPPLESAYDTWIRGPLPYPPGLDCPASTMLRHLPTPPDWDAAEVERLNRANRDLLTRYCVRKALDRLTQLAPEAMDNARYCFECAGGAVALTSVNSGA